MRILILFTLFLFTLSSHAQLNIEYKYDDLGRLYEVGRSDGPKVNFTYDEVSNLKNKVISNSPDTDGDRIANFVDEDDDNDKILDAWERAYDLNPLDPSDANPDKDKDGFTALQEFKNGTNPNGEGKDFMSRLTNGLDVKDYDIPFLPVWAMLVIFIVFSINKIDIKTNRKYFSFLLVFAIFSFLPFVSPIVNANSNIVLEKGWHSNDDVVNSDINKNSYTYNSHNDGGLIRTIINPTTEFIRKPLMVSNWLTASQEMKNLAESLENNPVKIYSFVKNKIDYIPYFGYLQGGQATYLIGAGNDFDQSALLIDLLRASGFVANYKYGTMTIPVSSADKKDFSSWLGVSEKMVDVYQVLGAAGIPISSIDGKSITVDRVWVEATINGEVYQLDPAFKSYKNNNKINLIDAMKYNKSSLLKAAAGEIGQNYVKSLSEAGLTSRLNELVENLNDYIKKYKANELTGNFLGSFTIVEEDIQSLPKSLHFNSSSTEKWSSVPDAYIHKLRIKHGGIDEVLNYPDVAGKKLSLTYKENDMVSRSLNLNHALPLEKSDVRKNLKVFSLVDSADNGISNNHQLLNNKNNDNPLAIEISKDISNIDNSPHESRLMSARSANTYNFRLIQQPLLPVTKKIMSYKNPFNIPLYIDTTFYGYNSGFQIVSGGGRTLLQPNQTWNLYARLNNTSRGQKNASVNIKISCGMLHLCNQVLDSQVVNLTAFVSEMPKITGNGVNFSAYANEPKESVARITNNGSQNLTIRSVNITGATDKFTLISGGGAYTLAPGATRAFRVRYVSNTNGSHNAKINISYDYDGVNNLYKDNLNLIGRSYLKPNIQNSYGRDFSKHYVGYSINDDIVLKNNGVQPLNITSMEIVGQHADKFVFISGHKLGQVSPGKKRTINIKYLNNTPGNYKAKVKITYSYDGLSGYTANLPLAAETINLKLANVYLNDKLLFSESSSSVNAANLGKLVLSIDHPYEKDNGKYADQKAVYNVKRGGKYVIAIGFHNPKRKILERSQKRLNALISDGYEVNSDEVLTQTLDVVGKTWMAQTMNNRLLTSSLTNTLSVFHHRVGLIAQEDSYYIDIGSQYTSNNPRFSNRPYFTENAFKASTFLNSAMEHGVLEQLQRGERAAASTIKVLKLANSKGKKIFDLSKENFSVTKPLLSNYSNDDLKNIEKDILNDNARFIIPETGKVTLNKWSGKGYVRQKFSDGPSLSMIIGGDLFGGYGSLFGSIRNDWVRNNFKPQLIPPFNIITPKAADPVDLASGAFITNKTDLTLSGRNNLSLSRFYNSQQSNENNSGLGKGWTHNYNIFISEHSDVANAFGARQPSDALATFVSGVVITDLMKSKNPTLKEWVVSALVADWTMEQLLNNAVSIYTGDKVSTFIKQPDGTYTPPPGSTSTLTKANGNYRLTERFGTVMNFNSQNKVANITDIDGNTLTFTYTGDKLTQVADNFNRSITLNYVGDKLDNVTDSTGRTVRYEQINGELRTVKGLDGETWQHTYDKRGQMLTQTNPAGVKIVDNTYDLHGRVIAQVAPRENGTANYKLHYTGTQSSEERPDGKRTTYYYDENGRTVAVEDALGNKTQTEYDGQGHVTATVDPLGNRTQMEYDNAHNLRFIKDAYSNRSENVYDNQHRLRFSYDPLRNVSETQYDNEHHPILSKDALNNTWKTDYYPNGLVKWEQNARGFKTQYTYDDYGFPKTSKTEAHPAVTTQYDAIGNQQHLIDQANAKTAFTYYANGNVKTTTDPLDKITRRTYWPTGKLKTETDRNGHTRSATYTATTKLDTLTYPAKAATSTQPAVLGYTVNFDYDQSRDRLVTMTDPLGKTINAYDDIDRLKTVKDPNGHTVKYSYDAASNLKTLTYPDGKTVTYSYDKLNRLTTINIDWLNKTSTLYWDKASRLDYVDLFNGTQTDYRFDAASRLEGLSHKAGSNILVDYQFTLDPNGNIKTATINNELIKPAQLINDKMDWSYNAKKNRLKSTLDKNPAVGRIVTHEYKNYVYDDEGQIVSANGIRQNYVYDAAHRLIKVNKPGLIAQYHYDGAGNRLKATRNGKTQQYIYDAAGNLIAEADKNGKISRYYIYGIGLMAFVEANTNQLYVYHFDQTGHTVGITNNAQQVVNKYAYSPMGEILGQEEQIKQPFTYAGQAGIYTEAKNLYYMRARYYDAYQARFLSEDPSGFAGGLNLYAYAGGNPVRYIDPTGLSAAEPNVNCACASLGTQFGFFTGGLGVGSAISSVFKGLVAKNAAKLTSQQQKSIRSLEKQISKHEKKLQDFKDNPTVRPGMENLPKDVIQKQQQRRINHLETEINTFKNNIEKIKRGEIDS